MSRPFWIFFQNLLVSNVLFLVHELLRISRIMEIVILYHGRIIFSMFNGIIL